jgi:hypothetical protein
MSAWIGPAIVAAFIGCLTTMLGWSVSFRQLKNLETVRRREKIIDYQAALRAEIRSYRARFEHMNPVAYRDAILELIVTDPSFTPFIPIETPLLIFSEIVKEIHILPTEVIDTVVLFYAHTAMIAQLTLDLKSEQFNALPRERKAGRYMDYYSLLLLARDLADETLDILEYGLNSPA